MNITLKESAGDLAFSRYSSFLSEIDRIKSGIYHNRKGEIPLTDISPSEDRLAKRVAREGLPVDAALERINGVPNFQDIAILRKILRLSESVCRITICNEYGSAGYGTGFLIAPDLIITNHHVLPDAATAKPSLAQFRYELTEDGNLADDMSFKLRPDIFFMTSGLQKASDDPNSGLDFTIVAIETTSMQGESLSLIRSVRLDQKLGKIIEGENCVVVQHPQGDYKKVVLKDIRMLTLVDDFMIYESDTLPGSSGSMVIGLGTGEVVALHHSGVPRKNAHGQWLRKDGTVAGPNDADELIDWIGNEGIRVSSILRAIEGISVPAAMQHYKQRLLSGQTLTTEPSDTQSANRTIKTEDTAAVKPASAGAEGRLQYFEVELSANKRLQEDWKENARRLIPGFKRSEPIFPFSTKAAQRRLFYISVTSSLDPWQLAASIEELPHVDNCTPDLPMATHMDAEADIRQEKLPYESVGNDGTAEWNEEEFKRQWVNAHYCKSDILNNNADAYRQWNRVAVNFTNDTITDEVRNNIGELKMVQLDTGYTDHSKVQGNYDFIRDADFLDMDEDARDEQDTGILKHPSHGTRTASLVVGIKVKDFQYDGNRGLLTENEKSLITLIPYRVAKSVVLIGRGKNLVDAALHAINSGTDVMYMCMGCYPRPMIEQAARQAYDRGTIWVCAAGNEVEMVIAPALYPGTIAVAAINPDQKPWKGSSYGTAVDIAAPGEDVYVPFINKNGEEVMVFGSGTSYATPHVASAAMLWKARWKAELKDKYKYPWQVVEAFRICLKRSANNLNGSWDTKNYGAGILDVTALLNCELPEVTDEMYAYRNEKERPKWNLGVREGVHFLWNTFKRKMTPGQAEAWGGMQLTERGRTALSALSGGAPAKPEESMAAGAGYNVNASRLLHSYFETYQK